MFEDLIPSPPAEAAAPPPGMFDDLIPAPDAPAAITDIPREVYQSTADSIQATADHFAAARIRPEDRGTSFFDIRPELRRFKETGEGMLSALAVPFAPIQGVARSLLGHPMVEADKALRRGAVGLYGEDKVRAAEQATGASPGGMTYDEARRNADTALSLLAPRAGLGVVRRPVQPAPPPPPPPKAAPSAPSETVATPREADASTSASGTHPQEATAVRPTDSGPSGGDLQTPSGEPPESAPASQQQIAKSRAKIGDALGDVGIPPDRVDPADIEGAARLVTRRDLLTFDAFKRAVIGDALERGFATPQEIDQVYGKDTADEYRGPSTPPDGEAARTESHAPIRPDSDATQSQQLPRPGEDGGETRGEPDATPGEGQPAGAAERSSETGPHPPAAADERVPAEERQPGGPAELRGASDSDPNNAAGPEETVRPDGIAPEDDARPPVAARLTGEELGPATDLKHLRALAQQYARENLVGRVITNRATRFPITINWSGMKKATSEGHGDDILRMVPGVPDMLEHGNYLGAYRDKKNRHSIRAVHIFESAVDLAGKRIDTLLFVRERNDGQFFYDLGIKRGDTVAR
jgi:hypothetical protein